MPGFWDEDDFQESGFASIKKFSGVLTDVEDDVEGDYGPQLSFHWSDVELIEAGDDVSLDNAEFTDWIKQSSRKGSTNDRVVKAYREFKDENGLEGSMEYFKFLHGVRCIFEKVTYDFGKKINPGTAFVPVEIVEEGASKPKKASKAKAKAEVVEDEDEDEAVEIDPKLSAAVLAAVEDEGLTSALIKAALNKKASTRKLLDEAGGIKTVLAALVDEGVIVEDDGVFEAAASDEDEDEDEDDDEDLV